MMIKQTLLETSARKFMPKLFAGISDDAEGQVKFIYRTDEIPLEVRPRGPSSMMQPLRRGR